MKYGKITITESGEIKADFVNGEIWMSVSEIMNLFGVFYQTLDKNIKTILKSGMLYEEDVCRWHEHVDGRIQILYNFNMITVLAFTLKTPEAVKIRDWLFRRFDKSFERLIVQIEYDYADNGIVN